MYFSNKLHPHCHALCITLLLPHSFRVSSLLLMQVVFMFYHWVVKTTETCSRSHWVTVGDGGVLQLWCSIYPQASAYEAPIWHKFHFLPSILTAGEILSKSSLQQTLSSQAQVSTRPALTSPAHCSCDLRTLCTAWWEEVTMSGEYGMQGWYLTNVAIFVFSLLILTAFFRNDIAGITVCAHTFCECFFSHTLRENC